MSTEEKQRRIMVILLGGRLTPNFIGILAYRPDMVECVVSEDEQSKWDDVVNLLSSIPHIQLASQPHVVPAYEMQATIHACQTIIECYPGASLIFNVTGATKVMGIAAYEVAKQNMLPAIYLDTTRGRFLNLTQLSDEAVPIQIGLADYLSFYGRQPSLKFNFDNLSLSKERAIEASILLASSGSAAREAITLLRQQNRGKGKRTVSISLNPLLQPEVWQIVEQLNRLGLIINLTQNSEANFSCTIPDDANWNYLDGTWLEVFVWNQANQLQSEEQEVLFEECAFSFEIPGVEGVKKEIDVGCIYQGQFIHCSCKSEKSPFKTSYLDEIRAVSSLVGDRFCSRLFITNAYSPDKNSGGWYDYQNFLQQAKDRQIVVVTGLELPNIAEILKKEAEKPTYWRI
jgi:hypothetical protein